MIDRKKIREKVGYTLKQQTTSPATWFALAKGFHMAAGLLHEFRERIPSDTRPFALNAALSIELGCILIKDSQIGWNVIQALQRSLSMARYELTEFEWKTIQPLLPNKPRGVPRVDDRRVLNGIFWILRSGSPWVDLPERYGPPTTVYNRFNRWRKAGIWDKLMDAIIEAHDGKVQMIDSSTVRVHQQAAAQKNRLETLVSVEVVED